MAKSTSKNTNKIQMEASFSKGAQLSSSKSSDVPGQSKPTTKVVDNGKKVITSDWSPWGTNNKFPQEVFEDLEKSSILLQSIRDRAKVHIGSGIVYGHQVQVEKNGEKVIKFERLIIDEIEEFLEETNSYAKQFQIALDLETYYNAFVEYIYNNGGTKIVNYNAPKAYYCRKKKQDDKGTSSQIYVSSKWPKPTKDEVTAVDCYDPEKTNQKKFMEHIQYPCSTPGTNYSLADWDVIRRNDWLDIAESVPKMKKMIFKNQSIIKYHIEMPDNYFELNCTNWEDKGVDGQKAYKEEFEKKLTEFLAGIENYGASIITYTPVGDDGQLMGGIKINVLDNKMKEGMFLPDSSAADYQVLFAIGVSPGIRGVGMPGEKNGGSGSFVREDLWKMQILAIPDAHFSLRPLRLISKINKWSERLNKGKRIIFKYGDVSTLRTLDQNSKGKEEVQLGES